MEGSWRWKVRVKRGLSFAHQGHKNMLGDELVEGKVDVRERGGDYCWTAVLQHMAGLGLQ